MKDEPFMINYISVNNCFLYFTDNWLRRLNDLNAFTSVLKIEYGVKKCAYFSWYPQPLNFKDHSTVSLSATYAQMLGLQNEEKVIISYHHHVASVKKINVSPVTFDDWEILEVSSQMLQSSLLDQIQIVWPGQILVAWVSKSMHVSLRVDSLEPKYKVGRIEDFTDVVVALPQEGVLSPVTDVDNANQSVHTHSNVEIPVEHTVNEETNKYINSNIGCDKVSSVEIDQSFTSAVWYSLKKLFSIISVSNGDRETKGVNNVLDRTLQDSRSKPFKPLNHNVEPLSYRVHPLLLPLLERQPKYCDRLMFQPYNVFIHKVNMPSLDSLCGTVVCRLTNVALPLRTAKESSSVVPSEKSSDSKPQIKDSAANNSTVPSNSTYVCLCVVEDALRELSNELTAQISGACEYTGQRCILVPDSVRIALGVEPGSRVMLEMIPHEEKQPLTEIQVTSVEKWEESASSLETLFRMYIVMHSKTSDLLVNSGTVFPLQLSSSRVLYVVVKLFPSELKYVILDSKCAKSCRITVNQNNTLALDVASIVTQLDGPLETNTLNSSWLNALLFEGLLSLEMSLGLHSAAFRLQQSGTSMGHTNILIVGKCGSGRSTLAKLLCKEVKNSPYFVHSVEIQCRNIKGKKVEMLHKLLSHALVECVYYQPSVLVLSDLEVLAGEISRQEEASPEGTYFTRAGEMLASVLEEYQANNSIAVIATAPSVLKLNSVLAAARGQHIFNTVLEVPELNKIDRQKILDNIISHNSNLSTTDACALDLESVALKCEGYVVQDLVDLVDKAVFEAWKRNVSDPESSKHGCDTLVLHDEDLDKALKNTPPLSLRGIELYQSTEQTWETVGGLTKVKEVLIELLQWPAQFSQLFDQSPLRHQSGLLLYGAPGTGKTMVAGAVAHECGLNFISIKGPELLSKYIGASEESVRNIFQKAQSAKPCVLFFDEFDSLAPRRGHDSTGVTDRVVNQLLTQLDGVESLQGVWVLAATSRPDLLDPALLRPGRLDKAVLCPIPSQEDRLTILKALSQKIHLMEDVDLQEIASNTPGFTGADLQAVLYTAQLMAVEKTSNDCINLTSDTEELGVHHCLAAKAGPSIGKSKSQDSVRSIPVVSREYLLAALHDTRPSLTEEEKRKYDYIYKKFSNPRSDGALNRELVSMPQRATLA